jgi:hypothetical protein
MMDTNNSVLRRAFLSFSIVMLTLLRSGSANAFRPENA